MKLLAKILPTEITSRRRRACLFRFSRPSHHPTKHSAIIIFAVLPLHLLLSALLGKEYFCGSLNSFRKIFYLMKWNENSTSLFISTLLSRRSSLYRCVCVYHTFSGYTDRHIVVHVCEFVCRKAQVLFTFMCTLLPYLNTEPIVS